MLSQNLEPAALPCGLRAVAVESALSSPEREPVIQVRRQRFCRLRPARATRAALLLGLALAWGTSGCDRSPVPSPAAAPVRVLPPAPLLAVGRPVAGPLAAGESRAYDLDLAAGQYLRLALRQKGLKIGATLAGPAGEFAVAGRSVRRTVELLSLVTGKAGRYRLNLAAAPAAGAKGSYELAVEALRPATPADRPRVAALRAMAEGLAGPSLAVPELKSRARKKLDEARRLYHQAGDFEGETDARIEICSVEIDEGKAGATHAASELKEIHATASRRGYLRGAAAALDPLAYAEDNLALPKQALASSVQAFELWRQVGDVAAQAETASNVGFLYSSKLIDYRRAQRWLDTALRLRRTAGDVGGEARTLLGLGVLHRAEWDLAAAESDYQRARELSRQVGDLPQESQATGNLAAVYHRRGELQQALYLYDEAIKTSEGNPGSQGQYYQNLGSLYIELGDLDKARTSYAAALDLLPTGTPLQESYRINALVNLGSVLLSLEGPGPALAKYIEALQLSHRPALEEQEGLALYSLGKAYLKLQQPAKALGFLAPALEIHRRWEDQQEAARTLLEMGIAYHAQGDLSRAGEHFERALELARRTQRPAIQAACELQLAMVDRDRGDLEKAERRIELVLFELEKARSRFLRDQTRIAFFSTLRDFYELYIDLLMQLAQRYPGSHYEEKALQASEKARARALLDLLSEVRIGVNSGMSAELQKRETELERDLYKIQSQLAAAPAAEIEGLNRKLLDIEHQQESLAREIRSQDPRYAEVRYPVPLDAAGIERDWDERTALLEYVLGTRASFLFVVTREGVTSYRLPPADKIEDSVRRLRAAIATPSNLQLGTFVKEAAYLHQVLIQPASKILERKHDLLIVPDATLHLLPFEALLTDPSAVRSDRSLFDQLPELPYLLRRHTISYVPSASVLRGLRTLARPPRSKGPAFLAFAAPRTALAALPESREEVEGIAGLYPRSEVKLYLGDEASKRNVLANPLLAGARWVHFATHGVFDETNPALSGLVLTPGPDGDDGRLRVDEVFNLKLNADLVVLSACDTGAGKRVTGEGLVGLARAFFYAGTPSLVVSLWPVSEDSAPKIMLDFYRRLKDGEGKGEALGRSKLDLLRTGAYAHPFYWAPFVLVGDPKSKK
jgi:CHAT domain-containing protein/Tfp pilus assembly protein PilF